MDNLTPEERQVRLKKADSIRRMLAEQPSAGQTNKGIHGIHKSILPKKLHFLYCRGW